MLEGSGEETVGDLCGVGDLGLDKGGSDWDRAKGSTAGIRVTALDLFCCFLSFSEMHN